MQNAVGFCKQSSNNIVTIRIVSQRDIKIIFAQHRRDGTRFAYCTGERNKAWIGYFWIADNERGAFRRANDLLAKFAGFALADNAGLHGERTAAIKLSEADSIPNKDFVLRYGVPVVALGIAIDLLLLLIRAR